MSRELLERTLLARIKEDLLCEEGIELFLKETQRLLQQTLNPTKDLGKQLRQIKKEIQNVLKAIKAGILTESTETELRRLEAKKKELESLLHKKRGVFERSPVYPSGASVFSQSRQQFGECRGPLLMAYSGANKNPGWGPDKTPSDLPGSPGSRACLRLCAVLKTDRGKSKIMVVAGARFCHFFTPPIRISLISEKCPIANKTSHSKNFHPFKKAKYRDSKL